jgi:hypothetical protein
MNGNFNSPLVYLNAIQLLRVALKYEFGHEYFSLHIKNVGCYYTTFKLSFALTVFNYRNSHQSLTWLASTESVGQSSYLSIFYSQGNPCSKIYVHQVICLPCNLAMSLSVHQVICLPCNLAMSLSVHRVICLPCNLAMSL